MDDWVVMAPSRWNLRKARGAFSSGTAQAVRCRETENTGRLAPLR